jgi:hypothetical protein
MSLVAPASGSAASAVTVPASVTICVTSCGRLDLLAKTIASFEAFNTGGRFIISEDSNDVAVIAKVRADYPRADVMTGTGRTGLMASIDRIYSAATTPFIFHLEDDWQFDGPVNWSAATGLLTTRDDVANVSVRAFDEIRERYRVHSDPVNFANQPFAVMHAAAHPEFFGWSSNPGLIRRSLYEQYAPFNRLLHDQMSGLIKKEGRTVAYLLPGVARHIGQDRNVTDPTMPARPRSRPAKWMRAIKKKLYYRGWRKDPF